MAESSGEGCKPYSKENIETGKYNKGAMPHGSKTQQHICRDNKKTAVTQRYVYIWKYRPQGRSTAEEMGTGNTAEDKKAEKGQSSGAEES